MATAGGGGIFPPETNSKFAPENWPNPKPPYFSGGEPGSFRECLDVPGS